MKRRGINYDTGIEPFGQGLSRPVLEPEQVRREMQVIARDLHCNAVRITGRDTARIALAGESAARESLEVWFSPFPCNQTPDELLHQFAGHARAAEALRHHTRVVFVLGCEMTLFNRSFVPGDTYIERLQCLTDPARLAAARVSPEDLQRRFLSFMDHALGVVRRSFTGEVTYASGPWEPVDWSGFDIVGVDHYRDAGNRDRYREQLRPYFRHDRPVVVTEVGCCTYRGAQDRGAMGWNIVDRSARPPRLREAVVRDEQTQADCVDELLPILETEGVDGAFWFTFAGFGYPHRDDPATDLDCASFGVVKVRDGAADQTNSGPPWETKRAFHALARRFAPPSSLGINDASS